MTSWEEGTESSFSLGDDVRWVFNMILLPHWGSYVFVKKIFFDILVSEYSE